LNTSYLKELQEKFVSLSSKTGKIDFYPERLFTYDSINNLFTDDGKGDGFLTDKTIEEKIFIFAEDVNQKKQQCKALRRSSTKTIAEMQLDYLEQIKDKTPYQLKVLDANKVLYEITKNNVLIEQTFGASLLVIEIYFTSKARTDALITTLALLRYKADKKELPENLEKLVSSGYLDKLPMDVCSDKPIIYKRSGDNFILYSLGGDFDDDNAKIRQRTITNVNGDIVFWPYEK